MLSRLISFALQQRVFVLAGALVILIAGWNALDTLPVEAFPDVQDVQVQIDTLVPGQAPEEVERTVTMPIEREMSGIPHMTQLRSVSLTGLSEVILTFADNTNDYFARQQVMENNIYHWAASVLDSLRRIRLEDNAAREPVAPGAISVVSRKSSRRKLA